MQRILYIIIILAFTSCGLDCMDKKTGTFQTSQTLKESIENKVFQFEMRGYKKIIPLDSGKIFKIQNAWVENTWHYECINNKAILKKDSSFQFVIDAEYKGEFPLQSRYILWDKDKLTGAYLESLLTFVYSGEDTFSLILAKKNNVIEKLRFIK